MSPILFPNVHVLDVRHGVLLADGNPLKDLACLTGQGEHIALVVQGGCAG